MMRVRIKVWLISLGLLPAFALAQNPAVQSKNLKNLTKHEFSVQQAVDYALKNNATAKNALIDIKLQEETNKQITANAYPRLNGSLGTTYNASIATQVIPNFISPATYGVLIAEGVKDGNGNPIQMPGDFGSIAAQFGTKYSANAGVSLNQLLFDGQVFVGLQARDASMNLVRRSADVTFENIKANIHKVYYQLVVSKNQVEILDANIALAEKNNKDTKVIYENGFTDKLDVDNTTVTLANLKTEKQKLLNMISNGYYALKLLMGMPIADELVLTDKVTEDQIKDGVLEAAAYKYEDRKDFQQAQASKSLLEYNVRRYKLSQIPTVSLSALYAKNAQREKWNFLNKGDWFTISNIDLSITVPIFNGFYTKSKIQEAKLQVQKVSNLVETMKLVIDNDVEAAKNNYRSAVATMNSQKQNVELAEKNYQQTKKKYESGLSSQLAIEFAQTSLKTAQTNYITAMYDAVIAKVDFLKATGKL